MISVFILTSIILVEAFNDSDVIITRSGHSDIDRIMPERRTEKREEEKNKEEKHDKESPVDFDVVFVPNVETLRDEKNENYYSNRATERIIEKAVTEQSEQSKDVVFITGKNNDDIEKTNKRTIQKPSESGDVFVRGREKHSDVVIQRKNMPLDCTNVICNNTLHSLCGRRNDEGVTRYRLFRNECYFRKVNCDFRDEFNRYVQVELEKCAKIGAHLPESLPEYNIQNVPVIRTEEVRRPKPRMKKKQNKIRRSFESRRSLSMGIDGKSCRHDCPSYCTDVYVPECALSSSGQQKVFLNHCKLDLDSCIHSTVWYRRPLYECVGRKRTQVEQNREFIVWMQRSGLIDKKGKLIKS